MRLWCRKVVHNVTNTSILMASYWLVLYTCFKLILSLCFLSCMGLCDNYILIIVNSVMQCCFGAEINFSVSIIFGIDMNFLLI